MLCGLSAQIAGYDVIVVGDHVFVSENSRPVAATEVKGLGEFMGKAGDLRVGWGQFDDFEVIYLYDRRDHNFGYAVNLQIDYFSEWGYAPF